MAPDQVRPPWSRSDRRVPRTVIRPIQGFMRLEVAGGLVLLAASIAALVWANVDPSGYQDVWHTQFTVSIGGHGVTDTLLHAVNDGLMGIFFLVVGLEVKRELTIGELATRHAALLPLFAAVGGMVVPALVYLALAAGDGTTSGWGIPMATDIAFALGALAALGSRVPAALVAFLLGVAVIDDIGAVLVIALVYSDAIAGSWLAGAAGALALMWLLRRAGVRHLAPYIALGMVAWFSTYQSGVHATIAAVAIGLLTPATAFQRPQAVVAEAREVAARLAAHPSPREVDEGRWMQISWLSRDAVSPLSRLSHALHPWSAFVVLPVFALANAGVVLSPDSLEAAVDTPVTLAVAAGLVLGKPIGIVAGAALATALRASSLPHGVSWAQMAGVGILAGIGFTVSLFITELAFTDQVLVDAAKIGVLGGSLVAAVGGMVLLAILGRRRSR